MLKNRILVLSRVESMFYIGTRCNGSISPTKNTPFKNIKYVYDHTRKLTILIVPSNSPYWYHIQMVFSLNNTVLTKKYIYKLGRFKNYNFQSFQTSLASFCQFFWKYEILQKKNSFSSRSLSQKIYNISEKYL